MKIFPFYYNKLSDYSDVFNPIEWLDFILEGLDPSLSIYKKNVKVQKIITETKDTKTFILVPNKVLKYRSGQHLPVKIEINGRLLTRYYSITTSAFEKNLSITVKRQPNGIVSNYLNDHLKEGDFFEIGEPIGNFVLPDLFPESVLFIAGGSGITPVYSILKELVHRKHNGSIELIYFSKSESDFIFYRSLQQIESENSNVNIHFIFSESSNLLTQKLLEERVANYKERLTFLCGPYSLQEAGKELFLENKLILENFKPFFLLAKNNEDKQVEITLLRSNKKLTINGNNTILDELEANGVFPPSGCRMGICHTCKCTKESGIVKNLTDNTLSHNLKEDIQLCISKAENNLELDL